MSDQNHTEQHIMELHLDLYDYTPVQDALNKDTRSKLLKIFGISLKGRLSEEQRTAYTKKGISAFCEEVNERLKSASSTEIYHLNDPSAEQPELFIKWADGWAVNKYAGILQFHLAKSKIVKNAANVTINIHSRFDKGNKNGYFLTYMFEKGAVTQGRVYDAMNTLGQRGNFWDLMLTVVFMDKLQAAMQKGLFRQYRDYERNDSQLRGRIDIARHIRENPIFTGRVSYVAREYTVDNPMNVLILRTYAHLERRYPHLLHNLIAKNDLVKSGILTLQAEVNDWQGCTNHAAIMKTQKRIANSLYRAYEPLRNICHVILSRRGINLFAQSDDDIESQETDTIAGLLIDLPKLWEEFLYYAVLRDYSGKRGPYKQDSYSIIGGARTIKPDYLIPAEEDEYHTHAMVLDAKYRLVWHNTLEENDSQDETWDANVRNDVFQVLAYMLAFDCRAGGVIFPTSKAEFSRKKISPVTISEFCPDRFFARIPYVIPQITQRNADYRAVYAESDALLEKFLEQLRNAK